MAAEFTWEPVVRQGGTSFTIRPSKGFFLFYGIV